MPLSKVNNILTLRISFSLCVSLFPCLLEHFALTPNCWSLESGQVDPEIMEKKDLALYPQMKRTGNPSQKPRLLLIPYVCWWLPLASVCRPRTHLSVFCTRVEIDFSPLLWESRWPLLCWFLYNSVPFDSIYKHLHYFVCKLNNEIIRMYVWCHPLLDVLTWSTCECTCMMLFMWQMTWNCSS